MATIKKIKLPDGNTHNIGVRESEIDWGDRNLGAGGYSVGDVYFNDFLRANRFAGLKANGITIEYSTDAGSTWSAYSTTDTAKSGLFTRDSAFYVGGSPTGTVTANSQLRITIDTGAAGIYTILRKFMIYISTNYSQNCKVTITAALQSEPDNYTLTICENLPIAGWSGWNVVPCNFCTYGNTPSTQYGRIRFLFTQTGLSDTTKKGGLLVSRIFAYGGVGWATPSNMALHGHAYNWDGNLNVTFPGYVQASRFYGPVTGDLSGTASSASNAEKLRGFSSRSDNLTWGNQTGTTIIRMDDDGGGSMGFRKNNPVDGQMSMVIDGTVYVKEGMKRVLDESDLSTSTSSTSTTTAATSSAVKTAYDLANSANTTANTALSGVNGNLIYDQTFTISNGVATFTPHVYQKGQEVTTNYAKSCFVWKYRLANGSEVSLTTNDNRGCTVTISSMGYGGHVIGAFTPS